GTVERGPDATEHRIESCDDGDREVGLEPERHRGRQRQSGNHAHNQAKEGDHESSFVLSVVSSCTSANRVLSRAPAGTVTSSCGVTLTRMLKSDRSSVR